MAMIIDGSVIVRPNNSSSRTATSNAEEQRANFERAMARPPSPPKEPAASPAAPPTTRPPTDAAYAETAPRTGNQYWGIPNSDNTGAIEASDSSIKKTEDQLVQDNAPILVLPEGQYNIPSDPQDFIDNSRLIHERSFSFGNPFGDFTDEKLGDNTNDTTDDDFTAEQVGQSDYPVFLDLDNSQRNQLGDKNAPFFYETEKNDDGDTTRITYFFHYAYNEGPGVGNVRQNHEGDWERITVEIDPKTQETTHIVFSAHEAPHDRREIGKDRVDFRDGHPVVYVADGSHGSYAEPGTDHHTSDPTGIFKDRTAVDTNGDGVVNERDDDVVVINTSDNSLLVAEDQAWYPVTGPGVRYGEIGDTPWTNGVPGPSEEKGHVNENGNG